MNQGTNDIMNTDITIKTEEDPVFIVRFFSAQFKRSLKSRKKAKLLASLKGTFALNFKDGQALTISVGKVSVEKLKQGKKEVHLKRGADPAANITIHLDANKPELKPKIDGLYKHLILAVKVGKLLDDSDLDWTQEARDFWEFASKDKQFPKAITILSLDEGNLLKLGEGETVMELEASSKMLAQLFSGSTLLVQELFKGSIKVNAEIKPLTEFSRVNLDYMLDYN